MLRNDFDVRMAPHVSDGEFKGMSCGAYFGLSVLRVMVGLATAPKVILLSFETCVSFLEPHKPLFTTLLDCCDRRALLRWHPPARGRC